MTNLDGRVTGAGTEGFYYKNTRFLSRDEVLIDGLPLLPAAVSPVGPDTFLAYHEAAESAIVPAATIYLEERRAVGDGLLTDLQLNNYDRHRTIAFELALRLHADFADSDEAETGRRRQNAEITTQWDEDQHRLIFTYCHPVLHHQTLVQIVSSGIGVELRGESLVFHVSLPAREARTISISISPCYDGLARGAPSRIFPRTDSKLAGLRSSISDEMPEFSSSNDTVNRAWRTAASDLASLPLGLEDAPAVPIAGFPLYQQFFGRDSLTISWQSLLVTTRLMRDSLLANAAWQGTRIEDFLDEEPGKMIHQARWGPLSVLGIDPFRRYYGDWATPVDFLIMVGQYLLWTNDTSTVRKLLPAAKQVLQWVEHFGDRDRDGFLEYQTYSEKGVRQQGWKDSDDAIVDAEGLVLEPPIAASEIQAYWYSGLQQAAVAFSRCGDPAFGATLLKRATELRKRFDSAFWMEDKRFYAMAIGPHGRVANSISSNAGHLLAAGLVDRHKAVQVADRLLAMDMFSGWGIRTLSDQNPFYNPFSYHRGSVWPVEQGTLAFGLARYGFWEHLHALARGVFDLTDLFVDNRLPEVVGGLPRDEQHPHPGLYPKSCEPQGWSASAIILIVQALLGLRPIAPLSLLLVDPHLPQWLPELTLKGLVVGRARIDIAFSRRSNGSTGFRVLRREGTLRVIEQPVPDSAPSLLSRGRAIVNSVHGL